MGSLGTHFHRNCNAMGDSAKISPCVPSTLTSRSVGRWEDIILPGHEDPCNCVDLGQSEWDQKLGKIECEFSLYDKRRWKWDDVYLLRGLLNIYSPSLCPPPLPLYLRTTAIAPWRCTWSSEFEMHLETEIEWTQRCTWRPGSSEFGDALGGRDRVNSEDSLVVRDRSSLEMHSEAVTERVWRCTCRLWSREIGGVLGGGRFGGRRDGSWDSIHWLTCNCGNVESWVQHPPRDENTTSAERWETGWERDTVDLGMMLYLVYAVLCVNSWLWHGEIERDGLTSCS